MFTKALPLNLKAEIKMKLFFKNKGIIQSLKSLIQNLRISLIPIDLKTNVLVMEIVYLSNPHPN
jgi:hypothetical protein